MKRYAVVRVYITGYKEPVMYFKNKSDAEKYSENKNKKLSNLVKNLGAKFIVKSYIDKSKKPFKGKSQKAVNQNYKNV